ncbi:protein phosphatase 1 regulatory subunit 3B-like [Diadema antillarum]|uniref:protein phosphatase 1 regulatory subunit 3B-like n=1 Tax=Diadema antillarum TaxID=105358 RepID=UPI003A846E0D
MPARESVGSVLFEMPVNTLMLSASPPGFGHSFPAGPSPFLSRRTPVHSGFNMGFGRKGDLLQHLQRNKTMLPLRSCIKSETVLTNRISNGHSESAKGSGEEDQCRNERNSMKSVQGVDMRRETIERVSNGTPCPEKRKKRVCFADSKGLSLQTVKYMDGPSNMPPKLHIHLIQDVTEGAEANPTHPFSYVPEFDQPASNYLEFRDRLEQECVCLENVLIKDNITVVGTIKVKNIAFEKAVVVRVTFDDWTSHTDVQASYVVPSQPSNSRDKYDTFSFSLDIPPNLGGRTFEFCINYTSQCKSFWDNNRGNNYKIVTDKKKEFVRNKQQLSFESLSGSHPWGQFSYWHVAQEERPYW